MGAEAPVVRKHENIRMTGRPATGQVRGPLLAQPDAAEKMQGSFGREWSLGADLAPCRNHDRQQEQRRSEVASGQVDPCRLGQPVVGQPAARARGWRLGIVPRRDAVATWGAAALACRLDRGRFAPGEGREQTAPPRRHQQHDGRHQDQEAARKDVHTTKILSGRKVSGQAPFKSAARFPPARRHRGRSWRRSNPTADGWGRVRTGLRSRRRPPRCPA
jgi:hypothetical protein